MEEFNKEDWIEFDTYWISKHKQYTPEWFKLREKNILTSSNFGTAVGNGMRYETPEQLAYRLKNKITKPANNAMIHGTNTEILAKNWYCNKFKVNIIERGLAIPKWYKKIGGSIDGEIENTDGIIEIKCPQKMYNKLINDINLPIRDRIYMTHYDQIQGTMAILNKKWCDYIVYCTYENKVYVEKIYLDEEYWKEELYPKLKKFIEKYEI